MAVWSSMTSIALDLSTTWIDCDLVTDIHGTPTPLESVFRVFSILLWYVYFPSIARDNSARLMYILFQALDVLAQNETFWYTDYYGFARDKRERAQLYEYSKEWFLRGEITFPQLSFVSTR